MKKIFPMLILAASLILPSCQAGGAPAAPTATQLAPTSVPLIETAAPYPGPDSATPSSPGDTPWGAYPPVAGDEAMQRGNFFVDAVTVMAGAAPSGMDIYVEGSLPTPCNKPRIVVQPPDAENRIVIELYSLVANDVICTQVIKPFTGKVAALTGLPSGAYTIIHEGQQVAEFSIP